MPGVKLGFFYSNGFGFTNLNAAFASQAFFCVYGLGFFVLEFENLHWTDFNTFSTSSAFVLVH